MTRWTRLVCQVRGHRPVTRVTGINMTGATLDILLYGVNAFNASLPGRVTSSYDECTRCGRRLAETPARHGSRAWRHRRRLA